MEVPNKMTEKSFPADFTTSTGFLTIFRKKDTIFQASI